MRDEDQIRAVSEIAGWKWIKESPPAQYYALYCPLGKITWVDSDSDADFPTCMVPDYLNDRNATTEALRHLDDEQWLDYALMLLDDVGGFSGKLGWSNVRSFSDAKPRQVAAAMLKACGKWVEDAPERAQVNQKQLDHPKRYAFKPSESHTLITPAVCARCEEPMHQGEPGVTVDGERLHLNCAAEESDEVGFDGHIQDEN